MRIKIITKSQNNKDLIYGKSVKIINADTGESIENVRHVSWECGLDEVAVVRLEIVGVECELEGEIVRENQGEQNLLLLQGSVFPSDCETEIKDETIKEENTREIWW